MLAIKANLSDSAREIIAPMKMAVTSLGDTYSDFKCNRNSTANKIFSLSSLLLSFRSGQANENIGKFSGATFASSYFFHKTFKRQIIFAQN